MRMRMDFWTRLLRSCWHRRRANYLKTNAGSSSRGLISASHAWRSTAFLAACQTRRDHLRVLRASAIICVKTLLVLQHLKAANAGRDRARTQPAQAAAGAGLNRSGSLCRGASTSRREPRLRLGGPVWQVPACPMEPAQASAKFRRDVLVHRFRETNPLCGIPITLPHVVG